MKHIAILWTFLVISFASHGQKNKYSYSNITIHNIEFVEITFTIDKKTPDTLLIEGILKQKSIIDEIPCSGNITLTKNWKLKEITLADDHTFAGNNFPKDTYIKFDLDIQSVKHFYAVRWSKNRVVNICKFTSNQVINGLKCNFNEEVIFKTDWNLLACILADDFTISGNVIPKSTFIRFDKNGFICCFCLTDPQIQNYHCSGTNYTHWAWSGGGGIFLYPSGRLNNFYPVDDIEIQGVYCKRSLVRGPIYLYESGKLKRCISARDQKINGVLYGKNFTLEFDENGNVIRSKKYKIFG